MQPQPHLEGFKDAYSKMVKENDFYIQEIKSTEKVIEEYNKHFEISNSIISFDYKSKVLFNIYNISLMEIIKFDFFTIPKISHFETLAILLGVYDTTDKNNVNYKLSKVMDAQLKIHKYEIPKFVYSTLQYNIFKGLVYILTTQKNYNFQETEDATVHYENIEDLLSRLTKEEKILTCLNFFENLMIDSYLSNSSDKVLSYADKLLDLNEKHLDGSFVMDVRSYLCNTIIIDNE